MRLYIWKLHTFNKHMKWQVHLALGRRRIYVFRQTTFWKFWNNQNFGHTKMYNLISNKQNTTKLKATKLTQGKKVLEGTTEGKRKIMLRGQNLEGKKWGQKNRARARAKPQTTIYPWGVLEGLCGWEELQKFIQLLMCPSTYLCLIVISMSLCVCWFGFWIQ